MVYANLYEKDSWERILNHQVWRVSLNWLRDYADNSPLGNYELGQPGWFVNIHSYETKLESECSWESHVKTIDIQYLLSGEEIIYWRSIDELQDPIKKNSCVDRLDWKSMDNSRSELVMRPKYFAIFQPGEGHCPMVAVKSPMLIRKAVVKIPISLFRGGE